MKIFLFSYFSFARGLSIYMSAVTAQAKIMPEFDFSGHGKEISSAKFSNDNSRIASVSGDKTCRIWSLKTGKLVQTLVGHEKGLCDCAWSNDDKFIATASDDMLIFIWDCLSGNCIRSLSGHSSSVTCCAFNFLKNNLLASGSLDETIRLWDIKNGKCILTIPAHADPITSICFCIDGSVVFTGSYDGYCRFWDVCSGACLKSISVLGSSTTSISFLSCTPNPSFILIGTLSDAIVIVDINSGKTVKKYSSHKNKEFCLPASYVKSENSELILCGSENGHFFVWDAISQQILQTITTSETCAQKQLSNSVVAVIAGGRQKVLASFFLKNDLDNKKLKIWTLL